MLPSPELMSTPAKEQPTEFIVQDSTFSVVQHSIFIVSTPILSIRPPKMLLRGPEKAPASAETNQKWRSMWIFGVDLLFGGEAAFSLWRE